MSGKLTKEVVQHGLCMATAERSNADCPRGSVGAVIITNEGRILGRGFNSRAKDFGVCICDNGVDTTKKGSPTCQTVHAEVMAIMNACEQGNTNSDAAALVTTRPPCHNCLDLLAHTRIQAIVTTPEYDDRDNSRERWQKLGREWLIVDP